jgi:N-acetylneuraminic acid mutarotase
MWLVGAFLGCGSAASPDAQTTAWQALAPLPSARQEDAVVALGGRLYVIGGYAGASIVPFVTVFDGTAWRRVADLPAPLHHVNAAVVGERIVVAGALSGNDFYPVGSVFIYDPAKDAWTDGAAMPTGSERGASAVGAIGSRVYVAGGLGNGVAVATFSVYDVERDAWTKLPDAPLARDHAVACVVDGIFWVIGGRQGAPATNQFSVDWYDPQAGAWREHRAMPTARSGAAGAVLDGRIIVAGGEGNAASTTGVFSVVEVYDTATDSWTRVDPMLTPRHGTGGAILDGAFVVPGGAIRQGFAATSIVEALRL